MSSPILEERVIPQAVAQAWRAGCENKAQARAAYARFSGRRARRPTKALAAVGWVVAGMLLGMGSLYAATGAPLRWLGIGARPLAVQSKPVAQDERRSAPGVWPVAPGSSVVPVPLAPSLDEQGLRSEPKVATSWTSAAASGTRTPSSPEQWQRAARGLREGDFARADGALRELTTQTQGSEREAAQLAHAQLLLSHGHNAEALSMLQALQRSASSSSVRRKSAQLLARHSENVSSDRSFAPPEGANPP